MTSAFHVTDLAQHLQDLLNLRKEHVDALADIDQTLARIQSVIRPKQLGRPRNAGVSSVQAAVAKRPQKSSRPRKFAKTAEELVIDFVKSKDGHTTPDVAKHWHAQGRRGTPDNTLTKLVKEKKIIRKPLEGRRGSSYHMP